MKILFPILLFAINAKASTWENFVEKLTQARADVELLSQEIDSLQKEKQSDLEQWTQRKTELEGQIQKEQLRSLQIGEKLKRLESRVKLQSKTDPQAQKKLLAWIERFETWVPGTIPFLHESRQESLRNLKIRAQKSQEPIEFVMSDFWLFVESEIKLAQSNEYKIVDIQFAGQKKKCEVARLGLQSLFVVTPDKKILKAYKDAGLWKWKDIESNDDKDAILLLVQNLKNKNGAGYYHLPMDPGQVGASL